MNGPAEPLCPLCHAEGSRDGKAGKTEIWFCKPCGVGYTREPLQGVR